MIKDIDHIVQIVNEKLSEIEHSSIDNLKFPAGPVFFIVGVPRSGTTVLLQTIINYYKVGYINNFIAKFWEAPVIGAILYKSMGSKRTLQSYKSDSGFTKGLEGPHEFGYFWRRFFKYDKSHQIEKKAYESINYQLLNKEIAGLEQVFQKPVVFKNPPALSLNIEFLEKYVPNSHFIYMKRDPYFIAQSIYMKRKEIYNDIHTWYSIKPKEFEKLKNDHPYKQIAGQIYYTVDKIEKDLTTVSVDRKTIINYEDFCDNPISWINSCPKLSELLEIDKVSELSDLKFKINNKVSLPDEIWDQIKKEINNLFFI